MKHCSTRSLVRAKDKEGIGKKVISAILRIGNYHSPCLVKKIQKITLEVKNELELRIIVLETACEGVASKSRMKLHN